MELSKGYVLDKRDSDTDLVLQWQVQTEGYSEWATSKEPSTLKVKQIIVTSHV
jgi:hypothetical protein